MKKIIVAAKNIAILDTIKELLPNHNVKFISEAAYLRSGAAREYDVIIISTPLDSEYGIDLAASLDRDTEAGIIVLVKADSEEEAQNRLSFTRALVLGRPVTKSALAATIRFAYIFARQMIKKQREIDEITEKLNRHKTFGQAKILLMQYENLTEDEAHKRLQQEAMQSRRTLQAVADEILEHYAV